MGELNGLSFRSLDQRCGLTSEVPQLGRPRFRDQHSAPERGVDAQAGDKALVRTGPVLPLPENPLLQLVEDVNGFER
jgi:hypothetical protein